MKLLLLSNDSKNKYNLLDYLLLGLYNNYEHGNIKEGIYLSLTIKDIAKFANVSHTTVSRVINNNPQVKPETREKILKLIKDLNFSPNDSARSLSSGKTYKIGLLIMCDLQKVPTDFFTLILSGMVPELNKFGYNLMLFFNQVQGKDNQAPLELMNQNNMDGVFVLSVESEAELAYKVAGIRLPLVLVNEKIDDLDLSFVVADDEGGAYQATSHLLDLGHRKIAFIEGFPKYKTSLDRKTGYHRALMDRGINPDLSLERAGFFNTKHGYLAMKELLNDRPDITAVFTANDLMALGAIRAIKEKNLQVPNDIAIVGFDDAEFAEASDPPLTTIKKSRDVMGREAARLMLELLESPDKKESQGITLPTQLIIRESSFKY